MIHSILSNIKHSIIRIRLSLKYGKNLRLGHEVITSMSSQFETPCSIGNGSMFSGSIGKGSYIGTNCFINAKIGRFCSIAARAKTVGGRHPYTYPFASTSPSFFSLHSTNGLTYTNTQNFEERKKAEENYSVVIGNDCWIGDSATLIEGVRIKEGAVVLAVAAGTKDVPPYAIVGGVPAKILKYRFESDTIDYLLKLKWWDKGDNWLKEHCQEMCNGNLLTNKPLDQA